jgi:hypothetical protein
VASVLADVIASLVDQGIWKARLKSSDKASASRAR